MAWTDNLTSEDEETLLRVRDLLGLPAFDFYCVLAIQIRIDGPLTRQALAIMRESWGVDMWARVACYFELRSDGCIHLKGAMS